MQLFYNPHLELDATEIDFDKEESRHITKVLRKSEGDILNISNGKGGMFEAEIITTNPKKVVAKIIRSEQSAPPKYKLHMAVAPTKNIERFEWFLEKATEIGITEITPILCERSERKVIKPERLERIIQSAVKQSLRPYTPLLNPLISFQDFIKQTHSENRFIAHCEDSEKQALFKVTQPASESIVLIGPEGDFSVKEIEMALTERFIPVTLGESRLRTETAAIIACHTIALANE